MIARAAIAFLILPLAACGGRGGFHRPDYAAEAEARCDEAESASEPTRALALYGMALEADPRMARAHAGRARIFEQTGRSAEAERAFSMAVEAAKDDIRGRHLLERAQYYRRYGRTEAAVRDLDRAIGLLAVWPDPASKGESYLLRAECRIGLRAWSGAGEDLDAAEAAGLNATQAEKARSMRVIVRASATEERR